VKITKTFALNAATAFQTLPSENAEPFNFVYVSGAGATTEPGRFSQIFARVKGETELALAEMRKANPMFHALSARPAAVDPSTHPAIKPYIPTPPLALRMMWPVLGPPIKAFYKGMHSPTEHLGRVLAELAMGRHDNTDQINTARGHGGMDGKDVHMIGQFPILENTALRRLAGL
jgi:hypothetical protein